MIRWFLSAILTAPASYGGEIPVANQSPNSSRLAQNTRARRGLIEYLRHRFPKPNPTEIGKNHRLVKTAFQHAASHANMATVRIYDNEKQLALGTVVTPQGHILSKASELPDRVVCRFWNGGDRTARVVAIDQQHDLALLRTDAHDIEPAQWAESDTSVGTLVAATAGFGNLPLALGVISSPARAVPPQETYLVGILLGQSALGPRVRRVAPDSPGHQAGLIPGDVITHVDGRQVTTGSEVAKRIRSLRPGDSVLLEIRRGQQEQEVRVKLRSLSDLQPLSRLPTQRELSKRRGNFPSVFQHDTVLQSNQCGGPLVDISGNVVGLNIARASRVASYAIPSPVVAAALDRLLQSEQGN